ncbi:MAG: hypothetical protein LBV40_04235 [Methanomicrobiales archaeon]|nr:hypothetical protein [Methanomicrobiales archaeon]
MTTQRPKRVLFLILYMLCMGCVVAAGTAAMIQGAPDLEAKVVGINELVPGADVTLPIVLSNVASMASEQKTGTNTAYDSLIAIGVKVTPHGGDGALVIKSDAIMVGDIAPGEQKQFDVYATIRQDAAPGVYNLPLTISYTYVGSTVEYKFESVQMLYRSEERVITAPITIAESVQVGLQSVSAESLNIGHEGIVILEIENTGYGTGYNTVAHYYTADGSPLASVDGTAFIGTFAPGQKEKLSFKLKVDSVAEPKEYPGGLVLEYFDSSGLSHTTDPRMFGVQVGEKLTFEIIDNQISIHPGETKTFEIEVVNTGVTTAHGAQAKASVLIPFTGVHDRYSLGDLGAGETVSAKFTIAVDAQAVAKSYKMDVFVRYKDDLGNSRVSDAMGITVDVIKRTGLDAFLHNMELMSVVVGLIVILLYGIYTVRKDKAEE